LKYGVLPSSGYGILDLVSFMVFGECMHRYAISSLMDMAYSLLEQAILDYLTWRHSCSYVSDDRPTNGYDRDDVERLCARLICLREMREEEVVLFYNGLDVPTRQILDSRGAIPSKTVADAKVAIQEMAKFYQKWHNGTSRTRSPHYTKDCPLKEEGKTLEEAYYTQFGAPFQGGDIEQLLWGSIKGTTQILRTKNEGNLSKIP
nr:hypothetical protein [Tanacetum cinerariifolium]